LTDGNTFSAASSFSAILDDLDRATFFGEETGGCIYGSNAYDYINLTLPNTQIKITIPIRNGLNNITEKNNMNRGVIPDFEIHNTIIDILNNKDSEMEFVFDHIARLN
jgi:C-terminal processing protease CtpA/Prc